MTLNRLDELFIESQLFEKQGQFEQAVERLNEILGLAASKAAEIRVAQNYWDLALPFLELAAARSTDLEMQFLLARAYRLHRRFADAVPPLMKALEGCSKAEREVALRRPDVIETLWAVCSDLQSNLSRVSDAIAIYRLALDSLQDDESLLYGMGSACFQIGDSMGALQACRHLLNINPAHLQGHYVTGLSYIALGDSQAAIKEFEEVLRIDPEHTASLRILMEKKGVLCDWSGRVELREKIREILNRNTGFPVITMVSMQANYDDALEQLAWTRKLIEAEISVGETSPLYINVNKQTAKRIRVGYFSPHFYDNPVAHLVVGLLSCHDRSLFEVFVYAYGPDDRHPVRLRIENAVEHFVDLAGEVAAKMAERIFHDEIDILIDLSGTLGLATPQVLAYRPAPVQVIYLGYIGTMGSSAYDYIIADSFVAPEGFEKYYAEKLVRMPHTFQSTDSRRNLPARAVTRQEYGLPANTFVFSNCGQLYKIQPEMFEVWTRVLHAVPNSVLWLIQGPLGAEANLRKAWAEVGLSQDRLILSPRVSGEEHLARIGIADLFIDTYPYGSGTIANDVLWAGLPLLTLVGQTMVSRMAGSLLHAVGLPELIAHSHAEYEQKAVHLATHPEELKSLRKRLSDNKASWPLFDTPRFTRNLENAYQQMVVRSRAGLPPAEITVLEGDVQ